MTELNNNVKKYVAGAVVGGVIGAVTALLFAPKSGKELRTDISGQVHRVGEKTQELASDFSQKSRDITNGIGAQTSEWIDKAKEFAGFVAEEIRDLRGTRQENENGAAGKIDTQAVIKAGEANEAEPMERELV